MITDHKDAIPPTGCIVRNNLAAAFSSADTGVTEDHNLVVSDPLSLFLDPAGYDLRLKAGSGAIDVGSPVLAPQVDIIGTTRPQDSGFDLGAYEFVEKQHILTVNTTGGGTVSKEPDKATYIHGDEVTLTASANTGWVFNCWEGDLAGNANPDTVTMNGDKTVTAVFIAEGAQYTLTANQNGQGSVYANPDKAAYCPGETVTLIALPDTGWIFNYWEGGISGSANPATVTMDSDKSVTAVFSQAGTGFSVTVNINGSGAVTREPDRNLYTSGEAVAFTALPDAGWVFSGWDGDLTGTANPDSLTVDSDKNVTATFIPYLPPAKKKKGCGLSRLESDAAETLGCLLPLLMGLCFILYRRKRPTAS
jgi:hypothetical protein